MPTNKLTPEVINAAILGFEEQKRHIDTQIAELRAVLTGGSTEPVAIPEGPKRKRRKMSAAGRKAIAEAQRKRWAAKKESSPVVPEAPKPKRKLSAAGKRAIVAATKKRWARVRAEAAKAQRTPAKKAAAQPDFAQRRSNVGIHAISVVLKSRGSDTAVALIVTEKFGEEFADGFVAAVPAKSTAVAIPLALCLLEGTGTGLSHDRPSFAIAA
jgi:hypothetical protein